MFLVGNGVQIGGANNYLIARTFFVLAATLTVFCIFHWPIFRDTFGKLRKVFTTSSIVLLMIVTSLACKYLAPVPLTVPMPPSQSAYSVRVETLMNGLFWTTNGSRNLCSAQVALMVDLVNKQLIPAMVSAFDVQILESSGVWRPLAHIHPDQVYFGPPTQLAHLFPIKALFFDKQIENRNIQPGETIRGWLLLNVRDAPPNLQVQMKFKATVVDFGGVSYTTPDPMQPTLDSAQPRSVTVSGFARDFTKHLLSYNCGD